MTVFCRCAVSCCCLSRPVRTLLYLLYAWFRSQHWRRWYMTLTLSATMPYTCWTISRIGWNLRKWVISSSACILSFLYIQPILIYSLSRPSIGLWLLYHFIVQDKVCWPNLNVSLVLQFSNSNHFHSLLKLIRFSLQDTRFSTKKYLFRVLILFEFMSTFNYFIVLK